MDDVAPALISIEAAELGCPGGATCCVSSDLSDAISDLRLATSRASALDDLPDLVDVVEVNFLEWSSDEEVVCLLVVVERLGLPKAFSVVRVETESEEDWFLRLAS